MGVAECAGCTLLAFGMPLAIFIFVIARDPLRIILFVVGCFFWLVALLLSSLLWFAVVPLREKIEFGLFFAIAFQEIFRFLFYLLLKRAEVGLQKVSDAGMHVEGMHSLYNAKHTISFVSGLGWGCMAGAFHLVNVLADAAGPGTPGLPREVQVPDVELPRTHGSYTFFFMSSILALGMIMLNTVWNVIFWDGFNLKRYINVALVVFLHFLVSGVSLVNRKELYAVSIPVTYVVLAFSIIYAYFVAGGSRANLLSFCRNVRIRPQSQASTERSSAEQQEQHVAT